MPDEDAGMDFFDKLKADGQGIEQARELMSQPGFADMVRQAQAMAQQMQGSGQMQEMMAYAQRASALATSGVPTPATVKSIEMLAAPEAAAPGGAPPGFGPAGEAPSAVPGMAMPQQAKVTVEVAPQGKPAYEATFTQSIPEQVKSMLAPGSAITVRVDPNDPNSMMWWGGPA